MESEGEPGGCQSDRRRSGVLGAPLFFISARGELGDESRTNEGSRGSSGVIAVKNHMRIRSLAGTLLASGGIILATLLPAAGAAAESESELLAQVATEQQDQLVAVEQDDPERTGPAETAPAETSPAETGPAETNPADAADVASDSDELGDPGEPDMPQ